jgi:caffeoyl-CoA O-methyltransferase
MEVSVNLVSDPIQSVMDELHARDTADRVDGTPHGERLRAVPPEVGQLLLTLAMACRASTIVEVGTSGGYSTLWLSIAAARVGGRVTTFEVDPAKIALARRSFAAAGVEQFIDLRGEDGGRGLAEFAGVADLVFIDCEKDQYVRLLDPAIEALRPGGLFIADNLISHASELVEFQAKALADERISGLVVPIGTGDFIAVRL